MRGRIPSIAVCVKIVMAVIFYVFYMEPDTQNTDGYRYNTQFFGNSIGNFSRLELEL